MVLALAFVALLSQGTYFGRTSILGISESMERFSSAARCLVRDICVSCS